MKILLADDHAVIHQGLKRIIGDEFEGVSFGHALSSQDALDLVSQEHWNVAILDLDLPGRGGLDLLRQIRADNPRLPVIIFSMHSEEQFAIRALKAGASGYVAKDSDPSQLLEAIHKVLQGGKYVSVALGEVLASVVGADRSPEPHQTLSDREFEVMRLIAAGKTTSAVADKLSLSVKTVSTYRTRILEKLQLETTSELIRYAIDHKIDG